MKKRFEATFKIEYEVDTDDYDGKTIEEMIEFDQDALTNDPLMIDEDFMDQDTLVVTVREVT